MKKEKNEILINSSPFETRVALVEDGKLAEFYIERSKDRGSSGNIYKGTIVRVLPGMQAAFVHAGLERTAFLHVSDISAKFDDLDEEESKDEAKGASRIEEMLKAGQEVIVQATKEAIGSKGARVSSYVSLPGRYLVLMPTYERVGVSRRIADEKERKRLRDIVRQARLEGFGFIIRTVCEGASAEEIRADMDYLVKLWRSILAKASRTKPPALLYEELDLTLRTLRDIFSPGIERILIDSKEEYERVIGFVDEFMPSLRPRVELYDGKAPLFDVYGIELEVLDALERKVWLRSGGHIVIDQLEALSAIDVNTGKYVGRKNSEDTILKTNLEAVEEVTKHLRLRNIGGIIVIDFIDMAKASNRDKVTNALREALKKDKARTNILKISELGIVEMTRKRTRESLTQSLCEPCPYCDGNGLVKGKDTVLMDIYRELERELPLVGKKLTLYVNTEIALRLKGFDVLIKDLEERTGKKVSVKAVEMFHREDYEIA
ncbi:MAG: Rne/Rng family ribonuclease [Deltaproteobacteria bacterium]|nr:Rne/Rng family ribonuclease [Deltaproteobacteria bacterium]